MVTIPLLRPRVLAVLLLPAAAASATAQDPVGPWKVDDFIFQEQVSAMSVSPDGSKAVWLRRTADKKKDKLVTKLHLADLASGKCRQLTFGQEADTEPRWSPSGGAIAFLSPRKPPPAGDDDEPADEEGDGGDEDDPKAQVWILRMDGGEPWPLTRFDEGVATFRWISDEAVLVAAREKKSLREVVAEGRKDETVVVEDPAEFREEAVRLFRVSVEDPGDEGEADRLTTNPDEVSSLEVSPDGTWVVYARTTTPTYEVDEKDPPRVFVRRIGTGEERELFTDRKNRPVSFSWRPDSQGFYALVPRSTVDGESTAAIKVVFEVPAPGGEPLEVPLDWPAGVADGGVVPAEDGFLAFLRQGVAHRPARYVRGEAGWTRAFIEGTHAARLHEIVKAPRAARVVYATGSASDPDHWVQAGLDGTRLRDEKEFLRPNKGFKERRPARAEVRRWKGAGDEEVEGILYFPHGFEDGRRHPLIVMPHGGPFGADMDRFQDDYAYAPNLYAQRGAFCLYLNYHGSEGYGLAFGESIRRRYFELELVDIFAGIDALVKEGKADPERLGLIGWSNGAILAIACLTLADVYAPQYRYSFKACAPGAGDVNWTSDYGPCAFGVVFDDFYMGGPPWKLPELYVRKSSLFHAEKVTTPTIIFFGDKDTSVPTGQGWEWYRALQQLGKAPVRFLLFPGEEHGIRKPSFQRRKLDEELAWFDRHFFGRPPEPRVAKDESPLAWAVGRTGYARDAGRLGVVVNGVLAPETVFVGAARVGRFEVTRAQWKAVFPDMVVDPGVEDFPMTGIGAAQAQEYAARLAELTGQPFRLLTEDELDELPGGPDENTLDWWAGFDLTPDAAAGVRERAGELSGGGAIPPLLEKAGSRRPGIHRRGDERVLVHDAEGNAGEWVLDKEEKKPVLRGGCAFTAADDRVLRPPIPPAYAGLRVALGGI